MREWSFRRDSKEGFEVRSSRSLSGTSEKIWNGDLRSSYNRLDTTMSLFAHAASGVF